MRTHFKVKLPQYLFKPISQQDFTITIATVGLGALAFIFYANFTNADKCNCRNAAIIAEGMNSVRSMNRAQQAYFLEGKKFAKNIQELDIGIKAESNHYNYSMRVSKNAVYNYAIPRQKYIHKLHSIVGAVFVKSNPKKTENEVFTVAITCQTTSYTTKRPAEPTYQNGIIACGVGTEVISR